MKSLLVTLGLLALLAVTTQLFRHIYMLAVVPAESVLAKYDDETKKKISASQNIDELVQQYEDARKKAEDTRQKRRELKGDETEKEKAENNDLQFLQERAAEEHKQAVQVWERRIQEITELHYFWWCGMLCLSLGLICFTFGNRWLGVSGMVIGFVEMIYWTSPPFRFGGYDLEFERLLICKLVYTGVTLVLLLGLWGFSSIAARCTSGDIYVA